MLFGGHCRRTSPQLTIMGADSSLRCYNSLYNRSSIQGINQLDTSKMAVWMTFSLFSLTLLPHSGHCPIVELPSLPKQQDQLQFGVWDAAVPGLYLWKHYWRSWSSRALYKWKECSPHQPNPGKSDRILSRTMPWEPGTSIFIWGWGGGKGGSSFWKCCWQELVQKSHNICMLA